MKQTASRITVERKHVMKDFHLGNATTRVFRDISLQVMQGGFVSVIGPSGSGKSTLLYVLGGLSAPTGGQVLLGGTDISRFGDEKTSRIRRQNTGSVFQFYNLTPDLNMEENVLFPLLLDRRKMKQYQERLGRILEVAGLTEHRKYIPRELSGDQQQRVATAHALIGGPAILFADEPTGNLSNRTGTGIMNLPREIGQSIGQMIIMMTHSPEAARNSGRIITVQGGVLV